MEENLGFKGEEMKFRKILCKIKIGLHRHRWSKEYKIKGDDHECENRRKCLICGRVQYLAYDFQSHFWQNVVKPKKLIEYKSDDVVKE